MVLAILAWKLVILLVAVQPIPANDAFYFDGPVINWLLYGRYVNPTLMETFPISAHQVFSAYPPLYQAVLLPWMAAFGTSAKTAMVLHLFLFSGAAALLLAILRAMKVPAIASGLGMLFLMSITFHDRPDALGHVFGLAALWCFVKDLRESTGSSRLRVGMVLLLEGALFTAPVVGAFYYAVLFFGYLAAAWLAKSRFPLWIFAATTALFGVLVFGIATLAPVAWAGFLENGRQTPSIGGLRWPDLLGLLKAARGAPLYLVGLAWLPWAIGRSRKQETLSPPAPMFVTTIGLVAGGAAMFLASQCFVGPNYMLLTAYPHPVLAAGMIAWQIALFPRSTRLVYVLVLALAVLASSRAIGMTTIGLHCAADVGYGDALTRVRHELVPMQGSNRKIIISSAYLYDAIRLGRLNLVHADWIGPRKAGSTEAQMLEQLKPQRLILTQFDYYRSYERTLSDWERRAPGRKVRLENTAHTWVPDASTRWQRVVQHVSWAPVIVTLSE